MKTTRDNPKDEADFRRHVMAYAKEHGWRSHTDPDLRLRMGDPGFPDLVLARGVFDGPVVVESTILIRELKMPGNYLSAEQDQWRRLLFAAGFNYAVWRPTDWDVIERELG